MNRALPLLLLAALIGFALAGGFENVHQAKKDSERNKRAKEITATARDINETINRGIDIWTARR